MHSSVFFACICLSLHVVCLSVSLSVYLSLCLCVCVSVLPSLNACETMMQTDPNMWLVYRKSGHRQFAVFFSKALNLFEVCGTSVYVCSCGVAVHTCKGLLSSHCWAVLGEVAAKRNGPLSEAGTYIDYSSVTCSHL